MKVIGGKIKCFGPTKERLKANWGCLRILILFNYVKMPKENWNCGPARILYRLSHHEHEFPVCFKFLFLFFASKFFFILFVLPLFLFFFDFLCLFGFWNITLFDMLLFKYLLWFLLLLFIRLSRELILRHIYEHSVFIYALCRHAPD